MKLYPIIGLEIHVQLNTKTKLFCSCLNEYSPDNPNKNICPFCTGQPGALPLLNKEAVKKAITFGVALGSNIPNKTRWDRKNYFYPDLPAGYQISQYDNPIVEGGKVEFFVEDKSTGQFSKSEVELTRAHLESDAAKLLHISNKTLVDFNRSGAPLIEIVTEPVITSSAQAMAFVTELQSIVRALGISDGDMEKGQMRFDCNLSLRSQEEYDNNKLPKYRTETKNINSVRSLGRAIEYEIVRQSKLLEEGTIPVQETRGWKDDQNKSVSQRSKEDAMDYRYFPEPDLQILEIERNELPTKDNLPKLPQTIRNEVLAKGLSVQVANTIIDNSDISDLFSSLDNGENTKPLVNLLMGPLLSKSKTEEKSIKSILSDKQILDLVKMQEKGEISNQNISKLVDAVSNLDESICDVAKNNNLIVANDSSLLESIVDLVIKDNPKQVEEYKSGKVQVVGFLIGQCMKAAKGQGNPKIFSDFLIKKIK
ncbi:MAG: Asp-tRNA(Asn)/Glu-tRNA(Gln) amidotransferase subunit GatB [Patescibacteria group bacterium]